MKKLLVCKKCKKEFSHRCCPTDLATGRAKYCSKKCARKARRTLPRFFVCKACGKRFKNTEGRVRIFCSLQCRYDSQIGKKPGNYGKKTPFNVRCKISVAKLKFYQNGGQAWNKGLCGEASPGWRGGISQEYKRYVEERKERLRKNGGFHTLGEWELLKKRFNYTCPACGRKEPEIKLGKDHIVPVSEGGGSYISNIQPLCFRCNKRKNTRRVKYDPKERSRIIY